MDELIYKNILFETINILLFEIIIESVECMNEDLKCDRNNFYKALIKECDLYDICDIKNISL
jgi:hypothetical protein